MAKKEWTDEERKAFADKMAAARAKAKQEAKQETTQEPAHTQPTPGEEPDETASEPRDPGQPQEVNVSDLQRQILELKSTMFDVLAQKAQPQEATLTDRGVMGTVERYSLDPANYPDPRERLSQEPRLQRFAFPQNFELNFSFHPTRRYQTIDGIWQIEPQFDLELVRIMFDEETGEPTSGRYIVCRGIFFEDPETAILLANQNGLPVNEMNERDFLNEMRYLRMRDWLLEAFYPPAPTEKMSKREMVIDGKLVEYYEINSESNETIPFGKLKNKLQA